MFIPAPRAGRVRRGRRSRTTPDRGRLAPPPTDNAGRPKPTRSDRPASSAATDAARLDGAGHDRRPPAAGPRPAGGGGGPRIARSRDGSEVGATPLAGVTRGLVAQGIRTPLGDVSLELPIPGLGIVLGEPGPGRGQIVVGELADRRLDLWDGAQAGSLPPPEGQSSGITGGTKKAARKAPRRWSWPRRGGSGCRSRPGWVAGPGPGARGCGPSVAKPRGSSDQTSQMKAPL